MLTRDQKREIGAVVTLAVALFLLLSLVPPSWLGARASGLFPENLMGQFGSDVRYVLVSVGGVIGAALVPVLVMVAGLSLGGWLDRTTALRGALLGGGLFLLLPMLVAILFPEGVAAGWIGRTAASPLRGGLGALGAGLIVVVLLAVLSVATLSINPMRAISEGTVRGGRLVAGGATAALGAVKEGFETARTRRREQLDAAGAAGTVDEVPPVTEPKKGTEKKKTASATPKRAPRSRPPSSPAPEPVDKRPTAGIPPLDLLIMPQVEERRGMEQELDRLGQVLVEKLRSFRVESELGGRTTGPVVTQYEVIPAPGVKVNTIANLDADLALAMKAESIRIVAPIPGKGAVGVEIPNPTAEVVKLREILEAREYSGTRAALPVALGKDLTGNSYVADLAKMPHMLVAGATGSGKSVCLNTIITSLLYRHTPETLRMLMIDPKMVELSAYADLPHLRHPVVTDPQDAAELLRWAVLEMNKRYTLLNANGVRSISEFNARLRKGTVLKRAEPLPDEGDVDRWIYTDGPIPYIVVVVDELADLILTVQAEVERPLAILAQKARAIGIHLIVATQRPSVNVITGVIKANFPCRIAFRVASKTDSRTILDQNGADNLLGNGDMLFLPPGKSDPVRIQGAFISTEETDRLVRWYGEQAEAPASARPEPDILAEIRRREQEQGDARGGSTSADWDDIFRAAAEVCIQSDQGSTSLLQRKLRIGYGRAARIVDQLEEAGILGPPDGSKPRDVLIGLSGLDLLMSGGRESAGDDPGA